MIRYRGHIVHVVTTRYPEIAASSAVVRSATRDDLDQPLGVISDGRCVPLSAYETRELAEKCAVTSKVRFTQEVLS